METSIKLWTLIAATLLTGLSAGLCFTWSNAVTPGIGRLDDLSYLQAFQHMNRAIINPLFLLIFFGPLFLSPLAAILHRAQPGHILWMLALASALYFGGLVLVTIFGNVPLNEVLDKTNLSNISTEGAKVLRKRFESRWNTFHLIRTISSSIAFLLMLLSCLSRNNNVIL